MPLIDTTRTSAAAETLLAEAGILSSEKKSLGDLLRDANIDGASALEVVASLAHGGDSDQVRLKAAELALKLGGYLKDSETKTVPTVNIIINDSAASQISVNPILIPR